MLLLTRSLKVNDDWTCQTSSYAAQHKRGRISTFSFPFYFFHLIATVVLVVILKKISADLFLFPTGGENKLRTWK